jgi:hypothetical protein
MLILFRFCTVFSLALTVGATSSNSFAQEPTRCLKVQCNLPLTGELATYGIAVEGGVRLALSELLAEQQGQGEFDWQDNQSTPKEAVYIMQPHLLSPGDIYILGIRPQTMAIWDTSASRAISHFEAGDGG